MKVRLGGLPHEAPQVPCVTLADVESVLSAWTGIPPERMGQDDRDRLSLMEPVLKARPLAAGSWQHLAMGQTSSCLLKLTASAVGPTACCRRRQPHLRI